MPIRRQGDAPTLAKATFAGGCFWCVEPPFDALEGVISTTSGHTENPTCREVTTGTTYRTSMS